MTREQMFAALSATNEAILKSGSVAELFQAICDAAVTAGGIRNAAVLLPRDQALVVAASAGFKSQSIPRLKISLNPADALSRGITGSCFSSSSVCISNDCQADPRFKPWRDLGMGTEIGAAAALPLMNGGRPQGVLLFLVRVAGSLTEELVKLLQRMADNIAFALHNFEREEARLTAELGRTRSRDMFAALSAANAAILRSRNVDDMLTAACEAVAKGRKSLGAAAIFMEENGANWLKLTAASGLMVELIEQMALSVDPNSPFGQGLHGPAYRQQELQMSIDTAVDDRVKPWFRPEAPPHGCAALPLCIDGRSVGVLFFFFGRSSTPPDPEIVQLMKDIAENISFGLQLFAHQEEQSRLARMFAALSNTNEAIVKAQSRDELFQLVCDAIVEAASFTSATIALLDTDDGETLKVRASSGPHSAHMMNLRLSASEEKPEGQGLTGTAFRSGKTMISNNWSTDELSRYFRSSSSGSRSGCAIPLFGKSARIGVMMFFSRDANAFTAEFIEVLERLGRNVSFALSKFDGNDERKEAEQRIEFMATHDALTGLPNRVRFTHFLNESIDASRATNTKCAVIFIDLDRFKVINDTLGHEAGDQLLIACADRIRRSVGPHDLVARLGGDEFVVVCNSLNDANQVSEVAERILENLQSSLLIRGHECRTTGSIGIALYPEHGADGRSLTKNADIAMYAAKLDGKNAVRFFCRDRKAPSLRSLLLESELARALENNQLSLHYQPKVGCSSGEVSGVEALLRWNHPAYGQIPPSDFIPIAEESGLIIPIGKWALDTACAQAVAWTQRGIRIPVAVNLSLRQFSDPDLVANIDKALLESGLEPALLQIEVTESMVMRDTARTLRVLNEIKDRGLSLAIDDFGTGYSSMSLMKHFPIDTIKIDRSFVRDLCSSAADQAIANAIISMAKALDLKIVAEGVETEGQAAFLKAKGCDELQGFLYSRPLPSEDVFKVCMSFFARATDNANLQVA